MESILYYTFPSKICYLCLHRIVPGIFHKFPGYFTNSRGIPGSDGVPGGEPQFPGGEPHFPGGEISGSHPVLYYKMKLSVCMYVCISVCTQISREIPHVQR